MYLFNLFSAFWLIHGHFVILGLFGRTYLRSAFKKDKVAISQSIGHKWIKLRALIMNKLNDLASSSKNDKVAISQPRGKKSKN